jgi:hypothetical protein
MTPEQLQELKEKAELWDNLSPILKTIHGSKFYRPNGTSTIENISNSSSHIGLLETEFNESLCSCHMEKCQCLHIQ